MDTAPRNAPALRANWLTITGSVRDHNEDAIGIYPGETTSFFVLCDGVGGAEAGEFVSEFAVKRMLKMFHETPKSPSTNWSEVMQMAMQAINAEVRRVAESATEKSGKPVMMGSTMVAVVIQGWNAFVAHVGDSRLYHWRSGGIVQATEDHSTVSTMMMPAVNPDGTVKRNVLMRGIGKGADLSPDLLLINLEPGDKLLMCSDGMSDKINVDEIAQVLSTMPLSEAPNYLATLADTRMSKDNISVIIVDIGGTADRSPLNPPEQERAFLSYNTRWNTTSFQADGISTSTGGSRNGLWIGLALAVVAIVAVVAILLLTSRGGDAGSTAVPESPVPLILETEEIAPTATETPVPTATPTPTATFTPTQTETPSATPIPPTATLRS